MNKPNYIDPAAAERRMKQIMAELSGAPVEVLEEAKRRQAIAQHNWMVDAKKAAKGKAK